MLPSSFAFVDIETTGPSPLVDRAIEVGIVRVDGDDVSEFSTLLDPGVKVPEFIQNLTGIDQREVERAPTFFEMKDRIAEMLEGTLFVAHNVRFDFGFLKHEFKRHNMSFSPKMLCTVKLSRSLYPGYRKHDLSTIIERFGIECEARHRALGDAKAIWEFYKRALGDHSSEKVVESIESISRRPSLPPQLAKKYLHELPEAPGVYSFYDKGETPLYIGKSTNVRERVLSHFSNDYTSARQLEMVSLIEHIDVRPTAGDLSAQLLESEMIKMYQPLFNKQLRNMYKIVMVKKVVGEDGYFSCEIVEKEHIDLSEIDDVLGVFRSKKQAKEYLSGLVREYSLCQRLLGLQKAKGACFANHLGWCRGACKGSELSISYNMRFTEAFSKKQIKPWPFDGAVVIEESFDDLNSTLLIDKWCVVKNLVYKDRDPSLIEEELYDIDALDIQFDYGVYKILLGYIQNYHHLVKPFSSGSLV